jgi:hypothetical protein
MSSDDGMKQMVIGGLICIVGIVVTVGSFNAARAGGSYVVAYGAIIWGGFQFLRGLYHYNNS